MTEGTARVELKEKRFLVVDDNETARRIVREALEQQGAVVSETASVDAALELLRGSARDDAPYDAAIVDTVMPERDGFDLASEVAEDESLTGLRLLMVSSAAEVGGQEKARELGIKGYLTKPAPRADLIDAARALLGLRGPGEGVERRMVTADSLVSGRRKGTILLAEDNKTNQQIAATVLTKRGHEVDVVENGIEALEQVKSKRYDVVLMDIQMPHLDGLEATREIRKVEGLEQLPIVAVTAHALADERERCESAGMNDIVTKPFKPFQLHEAVERWLGPPEGRRKGETAPANSDTGAPGEEKPVDLEAFRATMAEAGVEEIVSVTLSTYLEEAQGKFAALKDAVHKGDGRAIDKAAHALKSASGSIRADSLAGMLQQLENAGVEGDIDKAGKLFRSAQEEYERVMVCLRTETE